MERGELRKVKGKKKLGDHWNGCSSATTRLSSFGWQNAIWLASWREQLGGRLFDNRDPISGGNVKTAHADFKAYRSGANMDVEGKRGGRRFNFLAGDTWRHGPIKRQV